MTPQALEAELSTQITPQRRLAVLLDLGRYWRLLRPDQVGVVADQALQLARTLQQPADQAQALLLLGEAQYRTAQHGAARQNLLDAYQQLLRLDHGTGQAEALIMLGNLHYALSELSPALEYYIRGLALCRQLDERLLESNALNGIAATKLLLAEYSEALEYFHRSLLIKRQLGDRRTESGTLNNLAVVYQELDDQHSAAEMLTQSLAIKQAIGDRVGEAMVCCNLGYAYHALGQNDSAVPLLQKALQLSLELGHRPTQAAVLENLGRCQASQEQPQQAIAFFQQALELQRSLNNLPGQISALLQLGEVGCQQGQCDQAETALLQALELANEVGARRYRAQAHHQLARLYEEQGNAPQALYHLKAQAEQERQLLREQMNQRVAAAMAEQKVERAMQEAEIQRLRNVELAQANHDKTLLLEQLQQQAHELEHLAMHDPLTRLPNRRYLEDWFQRTFAQHRQLGLPLSACVLDLDHFKLVNDRFSHALGDRVLQIVARLLTEGCRASDRVARYGGEEFVLVFPGIAAAEAQQICARLCHRVAEYDWESLHPGLKVTLSMGLSDDPQVPNHEKLLALADLALYQAKAQGRNRLVVHSG